MEPTTQQIPRIRFVRVLRFILILSVVICLGLLAARSLLFVSSEQACVNTELTSLRTPIAGHLRVQKRLRAGAFFPDKSEAFSVENDRTGNLEISSQFNYLQNSIDALENEIAQDTIRRSRYQADYLRVSRLVEGGAVSRREFEEIESALRALESSLEKKSVQLLHLRERFEYTKTQLLLQKESSVVMERGGVVWAVQRQDGEYLNTGDEIAQVIHPDEVWVDAFFSERYAKLLRPGAEVEVRELGSSRKWQGKVVFARAGVGRVAYSAPVAVPPQKLKERLITARVAVDWGESFTPEEFYGVGRSVEVRIYR